MTEESLQVILWMMSYIIGVQLILISLIIKNRFIDKWDKEDKQ